MTNKEKILALVNRFEDDIPFEDAIEKMHLLQGIEAGLKDIAEGRVTDHDEFMAELMAENEEIQARLDGKSQKTPAGNKGRHRQRSPKDRTGLR